jgi:subtilase family serine protease
MIPLFRRAGILLPLLIAAVCGAQSASSDRIVRVIDNSQTAVVKGSVSPLASPEFDQGPADASMKIAAASIIFKPSLAQQTALQKLLQQQQDPSSPSYHQWLTPEQYADRFGLTSADIGKVVSWLQSEGLSVDRVSRGRTQVWFSGTVGKVEGTFQTQIHNYIINGEKHFAAGTNLSVPAAFSDAVLGFRNLDDFRPQPSVVRALPEFTSSISGDHFLAPDDFATIYDIKALYNAGFTGTGQKIAITGQTEILTTDIDAFRAASNLPANDPQLVLVPNSGTPVISSADLTEADLDLEWSGGIASNATIIYVYVGNSSSFSVFDSLEYAIDNNLAPVVSISYGACESGLGTATVQGFEQLAQQGNAQGQTITAASGDSGAAACDSDTAKSASKGFAVSAPASVPEITAVGGSEFSADLSDPSAYWNSTNNSNSGSAISYIPEEAWNDTSTNGTLSASGGGASIVFAKPTWQSGTGVPNDGKRDVPDISLNASSDHDGYLLCSNGSCVNGYRQSNNDLTVVGGTSAGAPTFAAILALVNQATQSKGLGNANVTLYAPATTLLSAFHDITSGNNDVPCTKGSTTCPSDGILGFNAGVGYDQVTGLGTVDAYNLANAWPNSSPNRTTTSTAIQSSSPTITAGGSVTFTATVTPGSSSATLTGTVQFKVDGVSSGAPVLVANDQAIYTATTLMGGSHAVTAVYSGDLNFQGSTSPATTEKVMDFSLSSAPPTLTLASGKSANTTLTVQAEEGFSGTVDLTCVPSVASAGISCTINPGSAALSSSTTSGTATLTVTTASSGVSRRFAPQHPDHFLAWFASGGGGILACIFMVGLPLGRRRAGLLRLLLFVLLAVGLGCGGGGSASQVQANTGTPAGNYYVAVTAAGGGLSHSINVSITVQ